MIEKIPHVCLAQDVCIFFKILLLLPLPCPCLIQSWQGDAMIRENVGWKQPESESLTLK